MKKIIFLLCVSISISTTAQTITWTGAVDVNFNNPSNWSPAQVPIAINDVVIPSASVMTVNASASILSIDIQGTANVTISSNLTFTEPSTVGADAIITWTGGVISGGSTLTNNGVFNLTTNSTKSIVGLTTLNNENTINITTGGDLNITDGILNNQPTGVIDMQADGGNISYSGSASRILNNYGLIKRSTSSGNADILVFLNNIGGTISVENGNLNLNFLEKTFTDGTYNVATGASLTWGTNIIFAGTSQGVNDGDINWNNTVTIPNATIATFQFTGTGSLNWQQNNLTGGGSLELMSPINLTTNSTKNIVGLTTLNNESTINITSGGDLNITDGILNNQPTGVIDMQADGGNISYSGSASRILNNYGLIKRSTSTGNADILVFLNNFGGTISVESGNLNLNFLEKTFIDGTYNVAAGASLTWGTDIIFAGTIQGVNNGDINWNSTVTIPTATVVTFQFTGTGSLNWRQNNLTGGGTLELMSPINLTTNSTKSILGLTTLNNENAINITAGGDLNITDGVLNNQLGGVIDMQADGGNISYSGSASRILNNYGLIKKSTSTGNADILVFLNNFGGTISVESGNLNLNFLEKTFTDGTYNVVAGASLTWGTNIIFTGISQGVNNGVINWNNTVTIPNATVASFQFTGAGSLNWQLGSLSGGGTLELMSPLNLTTNSTKSILGLTTLNNENTINIISGGDLNITDGVLNNQLTGVIDMQVDGGNISYSGAASRILNNFGLIKKSAGLGVTQILVQTTNSGTIEAMTGELEFTDPLGLTNTATGIIKGVSTIDVPAAANFANDGTFAPGASPGTLTVLGDFESTATSVLDIELNGTVQGTEYDLLAISGGAIMDGIVDVTMGYEGVLGQEFIVATTGGLISSCTLAPTATSDYNGKRYDFSVACRNDNEVVLTIVLITDIQNPVAMAQDINAFLDETGVATITPEDVNNGSTDNCTLPGNLILSLDINSWDCSELGPHTVTLTVEDEVGLTDTATAVVTVIAPTTTFTAGTWTPNAPHLGSTAVVNDVYATSIDGIIDSCLCEVTASGTLNVNGGTYVRSSRDITVNGSLMVDPQGSVLQIDDLANTVNNGSITVQMNTPNMAAKSFMVSGSPMTGETREGVFGPAYIVRNHVTGNFIPNVDVEAVSPGINNWADDNGNNWLPKTGELNPGEGYMVFPQPNGTSSGSYIQNHTLGTLTNGAVDFNMGYNGSQNASPNILANPYASAIDVEAFFDHPSNSNIDVVYFWEHITDLSAGYPGYNVENFNMGDISMYSESLATGVPAANGGATPTQFIASGQGFGVKPTTGGIAQFNNAMRVTGPNDSYRSSDPVNRDRLWMHVYNDTYGLGSTALIGFTENTSDGYSTSEDVHRLPTPVSLYSELETGEELVINALGTFETSDAIYLSFTTQVKEAQDYRISIQAMDGVNLENASVYLIDNLTGSITNLTEEDYTFQSGEAVYHKRFKVVFENSALGINASNLDLVSLYPNPTQGTIHIISPNLLITHAQIYDIGGRLVSEVSFTNQGNYQLDISNLESAMYMVQIFTEKESILKRIVKK